MALTSATITKTASVIVADSVNNFTAASNAPVVVAYAPGDSDTVAPDGPWFERRPGDAVSRALLGPGHIWAYIVRTDRSVEGVREIESDVLPISAW